MAFTVNDTGKSSHYIAEKFGAYIEVGAIPIILVWLADKTSPLVFDDDCANTWPVIIGGNPKLIFEMIER